jgi:phytoene desaturase
MPEKVAVVGAGIGGLAVAVRLAAKGYAVDVFEKNDGPGGKMSEIRHEGYRFDTGPSLFTLPHLIRELFDLAGEDINSHFHYFNLAEVCRYFYEDGMVINAYAGAKDFATELHDKLGEDKEKVLAYLDESRKVYEFTNPVFISNSLHLFRNYFTKDVFRALFILHKLKPFTTLHQINHKYFRHPNSIKLFDRFATYNGSDPYKTPATLRVIAHLEHNTGAYFPEKGMFEITRALVALCERMGVRFFYNSRVEEILIKENKIAGIRVNQAEIKDFDLVVSDLDIWYLYKNLLRSQRFPGKWFRHERSTSAIIFYWGMETQSPGFDLHNILFASDYQQEFNCLFNLKTLYPDPTVYIFISSKIVKEDAPDGCENWFVMINAPENTGQDWDEMITGARNRIEEKIKKVTGIEVSQHRKFEFVLDPRGIETKTASYRGSLYGNSSNSAWAAFQRHPNFSAIKGLYFTGGSVHPGGGIPLCLSSAKIVAGVILSKK